jgi:hypothetical protein
VAESPVVSTTDVTSVAGGTGATAASEVDKAGTSTAPATEEEGGDLYMADPRPTLDPRWLGGARVWRMTHIGAYTSAPRGRRRSSPTAAMTMSSRRRRAQSSVCWQ